MNSESSRQFAIEVGKGPRGIAVSKDGSRVYVGNYISGDVSVIDTKDRTVIATIKVGEYPQRVALSPDESLAFVTNYGSGSISVVNTQTLKCIRDIDVGVHPCGIVSSPDGKCVYTHVQGRKSLAILNTDTFDVTHAWESQLECRDIGISPDGSKLYVTGSGYEGIFPKETLTIIDSQTLEIIKSVKTPQDPWWISVNPNNGNVYVMCQFERKLAVVDAEFQLKVADSVYTEGQLAFDGQYAYLLDFSAKEVVVIDTVSHEVQRKLAIVGAIAPWNVTYANGALYFSDYSKNSVCVMDTLALIHR
ncbi:YncE family protein [Pseudomonas sp. LB1P83]